MQSWTSKRANDDPTCARQSAPKSRVAIRKQFFTADSGIAVTVGFLYGAGAETLLFVTGTSGKNPKIFVSQQKNQSQLWIPRKPRKIGVWVSGAEIQTSAVDTRTAVWVSTPEKFSKIVLGKTWNFSRMFRGVSAPALYKNPAVMQGFSAAVILASSNRKENRCSLAILDRKEFAYLGRRESSRVWNGWGYGVAFSRALNSANSESDIWRKSLCLRNYRTFLQIPASEKYTSVSECFTELIRKNCRSASVSVSFP